MSIDINGCNVLFDREGRRQGIGHVEDEAEVSQAVAVVRPAVERVNATPDPCPICLPYCSILRARTRQPNAKEQGARRRKIEVLRWNTQETPKKKWRRIFFFFNKKIRNQWNKGGFEECAREKQKNKKKKRLANKHRQQKQPELKCEKRSSIN